MKNIKFILLGLITVFISACSASARAVSTPTMDPLVAQGKKVFNILCAAPMF